MQNVSCQPNEADTFSAKNIRQCERYVRSIQRKLDKAVANGDNAKIRWYFHLLSKRSRAVKVLAVNRVTRQNQGKKTAGIDGVALPLGNKNEQNQWRFLQLNSIDVTKKPDPIRRVFIPKPNGKSRPLGILTIADRIVQDILRIALEPITEYHFNNQSYGFRPKRCTSDAREDLFTKLCRKGSRRWIVEGDIRGCFDSISHNAISDTLRKWKTPVWVRNTIDSMLKSKIFYDGIAFPSEEGTPQGGPLSPMLANVALTALDNYGINFGWTYWKGATRVDVNPIVRYADDWVIVCQTEYQAKIIKQKVAQFLKEVLGLDLSDEKTQITHISKGFNFLGFNIRKYGKKPKNLKKRWEQGKLITKPQKEKVNRFLNNCKKELKTHKTATQGAIIRKLNPKLIGWGNYYRFVCSKQTFNQVNQHLWWKCYRWAKRRHSNKSKSWVIQRYFSRIGNRKTVFHDQKSHTTLFNMASIPCSDRWIKVNPKYRVHEGSKEAIEYWQKREYQNARKSIYDFSSTLGQLFRRQRGKCPICDTPIIGEQISDSFIDKHHMKPRCHGGDNKLRNLRLTHQECHREIHVLYTRKEMSELVDKGIDYISIRKPKSIGQTDTSTSHR